MKKKTLIIATMVAAMVAFAGCGKEDIPEKKDKSKIENVAEKMSDDFVKYSEKEKENSREQFPEKTQEETENTPTLTVIPHIREAFPEITIGDDIVLEKKSLTGETLMIENRVAFTVPEEWLESSATRTSVYYDYKDNNAPIEAFVGLQFFYDNALEGISYISWETFEQTIIDSITLHQEKSSNTLSNLTHININGYDGYCLDINRSHPSNSDITSLFIYMDGCYLQLAISYFDSVDPAIKESGFASAMEVISTLTPIKKAN